jgi:hypothetical protein
MMQTNSYFKVGTEHIPEQYFFFDKALDESVKKAYASAKEYADTMFDLLPSDMKIGRPSYRLITVWDKPYFPGPWETARVVGISEDLRHPVSEN